MPSWIATAVGLVAMCIAIFSFQQNTQKRILLFQIFATILFSTHYLLLGEMIAVCLNLVAMGRGFVFFNRGKAWAESRLWPALFIILSTTIGIVTWDGIDCLLLILAMDISTIGLWIKSPKYIRRINLPCSFMWMTFNILNASYPGFFTEVFNSTSIVIAMIRFDKKKRIKTSK